MKRDEEDVKLVHLQVSTNAVKTLDSWKNMSFYFIHEYAKRFHQNHFLDADKKIVVFYLVSSMVWSKVGHLFIFMDSSVSTGVSFRRTF